MKLCDFGFSKLGLTLCPDDKPLRTVCGSPQYMAPEINGREAYAGPPVDMWALGALVYEMLHATPAFRASSLAQLSMRILKASHGALGKETPPQARALIKRLLVVEPKARLSADELTRHAWLLG